jgi:hypothetical protein
VRFAVPIQHRGLCIAAKREVDRLTFDVDVIEGDVTGGDGRASLFIDRFGFGGFHAGFGRMGYDCAGVGIWNRPYVARGAWYRGAAVGAAAVGAAAVGDSGYYGAPCG